jgi:hypothetical protein
MSEFYAEPEITAEQEVALLRAKVAIYAAENDALRHKLIEAKGQVDTFAARVRQLEFEATVCGRLCFAQKSVEPTQMARIIPHDAVRSASGGTKPGL